MEFNRRVADHTPPLSKFTPPPLPPPGFSYFPNQSMPGHMGRGLTDSYKLEGANSAIEMSEFIRRELEIGKIREEILQSVLTQIQKDRIRDEIIVDEILRRRFLKADVERELSIERELSLPGLSPHEIVGRPRLSLPHEMVEGSLPREMVGRPRGLLPHEMVGRPRVSLPHEMVGRPIGESCASSLDGAESQQLDDYVQPSGTLIEGNQEHKKSSYTFWCDMCQMGTNSEYNMEIHRAGKKHHLAQKKNLLTFCCDVVDKHKAGNKHCLAQKEQLFRFWCDLCQIGTDTEDMMEKHKAGSKHHLAQKKRLFECWCDVCQIGTNSETVMEIDKAGKKHLDNKKQLFRFWCDECQIGTDTENVMEKHKAGNKHLSRLQEINQNPGDEPSSLVILPIKEVEADSLGTGLQMNSEPNVLDDKLQLGLEDLEEEIVWTAKPLQDVTQLQKANPNTPAMTVNQDLIVPKKGGSDGENYVSEAHREEEANVGAETSTENSAKVLNFWCDVCQIGTNTEKAMEEHKAGKKHHQKEQLFRFWCDVCKIGTDTKDGMEKHKAGNKFHLAHNKQLRFWCNVCQIGTNTEAVMEKHKAGKKHLANKKQLFRFWCDECQIGTDTENVMEKHKAGNKHRSRLQEINQNPGDEPSSLVILPIKVAEANSLDLKNSYKLLKKDEAPVQRAKETRGLKKNSFKYWCDICQLGADSEEVLKNHKYGKKHQAQLQKCSSSIAWRLAMKKRYNKKFRGS